MKKLLVSLFCFLLCFQVFSEVIKREKFIYDSKGKRDPFFQVTELQEDKVKPLVTTSLSPKEKLAKKGIVVNSIVWDPHNPAILINDDILEVGDTVQGVIIREIEQDYVVFEIDGELVEMPL